MLKARLNSIISGGDLKYPISNPTILTSSGEHLPGTMMDANTIIAQIKEQVVKHDLDTASILTKLDKVVKDVDYLDDYYSYQKTSNKTGIKINCKLDDGDTSTEPFIRKWRDSKGNVCTVINPNEQYDDFLTNAIIWKVYGSTSTIPKRDQMVASLFTDAVTKRADGTIVFGKRDTFSQGSLTFDGTAPGAKEFELKGRIGVLTTRRESGISLMTESYNDDHDDPRISLDPGTIKMEFRRCGSILSANNGDGFLQINRPLTVEELLQNIEKGSINKIIRNYTASRKGTNSKGEEDVYLGYFGYNGSSFIECKEDSNKIIIPQTTFEAKDAVNREYVNAQINQFGTSFGNSFSNINQSINNLYTKNSQLEQQIADLQQQVGILQQQVGNMQS